MNVGNTFFEHPHWRRSALKSAGALQGGEFQGIFTTFNTINFQGGRKSGGACGTAASASLAPLHIIINLGSIFVPLMGSQMRFAPKKDGL